MTFAKTEIIASALEAACWEMTETLVRTAISPNIKERRDCSTAICDIQGRTLALVCNAPVHLGSTILLVPAILKRFPAETLRPGDVFLGNDPYTVGVTHLNDCTVAAPIFVDGRPVGFAAVVAHHSDVGGRVPGSEAGDSVGMFQEGIRIPPVMLYADGVARQDLWELFLLNTRTPHYSHGDLLAQTGASHRGVERIQQLYERYGTEETGNRISEMLDATERRGNSRIREILKEGTYSAEDWLDENGVSDDPVKLAVTIKVAGGKVSFDLSDCSPELPSAKNMPLTHTLSTVYTCLKAIVDPNMSINEGLYRCVSVYAPEGSVANPRPPAGVSSRQMTSQILADVILDALGKAAPSRATAKNGQFNGIILSGQGLEGGRYFVNTENFAGGQGARSNDDGMNSVHVHMTNTSNLPIEQVEREFPMRIERYEFVPYSGGAGKFRGGCGIYRDIRILADDIRLTVRSARQKFPASGMAGGKSGSLGAFYLNPGTSKEQKLRSTVSDVQLNTGDLLRIQSAGGGGYGNPAERDPALVQRDIEDGLGKP